MDWQTEKTIYKTCDEYGEIQVREQSLIRTLYFGDDKKQSSMFLPEPAVLVLNYAQAMMTSLMFCQNPKRVLIVGLGGGSLFHFINNFYPDCFIDVVELRQSVIDIANRFFEFPVAHPKLALHHTDAKDFIDSRVKANETYDLVLIDAFDQWGPANILANQDFVTQCKELTNENGVCCFNLWNRREDSYAQSLRMFEQVFKQNLLELRLGNVNSNVILFGFLRKVTNVQLKRMEPQTVEYRKKFGIDFHSYFKKLIRQNNSVLKRLKKAVYS